MKKRTLRKVKARLHVAMVIFALFLPLAVTFTHDTLYVSTEKSIAYGANRGLMRDAIVTAYSSSVNETDDSPEIMASGNRVYTGAVACPEYLDFGTKVLIKNTVYTCEDRMAKKYRSSEFYDAWMPSKKDALNWGRQNLQVIIYP